MSRWLIGLWSTQAKVEGVLLKAAYHWGSNSSVISNHLREPGHTPFRPCRVPWAMTRRFCPVSWDSFLTRGSKKYDRMYIALALETEHTLNRDLDGGPRKEGGSFTGDF
jgi:hypothetical protein